MHCSTFESGLLGAPNALGGLKSVSLNCATGIPCTNHATHLESASQRAAHLSQPCFAPLYSTVPLVHVVPLSTWYWSSAVHRLPSFFCSCCTCRVKAAFAFICFCNCALKAAFACTCCCTCLLKAPVADLMICCKVSPFSVNLPWTWTSPVPTTSESTTSCFLPLRKRRMSPNVMKALSFWTRTPL